MKIKYVALVVAVLSSLTACGEHVLAQATVGAATTVVEGERESNRSGISEADIGSFEADFDPQERIGRTSDNMRSFIEELQRGRRPARPRNMRIESLNDRRRARQSQSQQNPPPLVHVQFQPSFEIRPVMTPTVVSEVQTRITQMLNQRGVGDANVKIQARTATLTGTVRDEVTRELLEKLISIEPGISSVNNLISLEEQVAKPQPQ